MAEHRQIALILSLAILLGIIRSFFLDKDLDPKFTLIKEERIIEEINSVGNNRFAIPDDISGPVMVSLDFSKHYFDIGSAIFIDARDPQDYEAGHIQNAINIPYDNYEEYEEIINNLDEEAVYIIYCSGGECSLSVDLAYYLYDKIFEYVFVFEGGWPEWRDAGYP